LIIARLKEFLLPNVERKFSEVSVMEVNCASFAINYETLPTKSLIIQTALLHKTKAGNEIFNHRNDGGRRRSNYKLYAIHAMRNAFEESRRP
jgi:hypothetical protein